MSIGSRELFQLDTPTAYALLLVVLVASACAQLAFKHYHLSGRQRSLIAAIVIFTSIPPVTFLAIRTLGIGTFYVFTSLTYALVAFFGWKLFGERINRRQLLGLVTIMVGCVVYTF